MYRDIVNIVRACVWSLLALACDIRGHLCSRPAVSEGVLELPGRPCVHEQRGNGVTFCRGAGERRGHILAGSVCARACCFLEDENGGKRLARPPWKAEGVAV